MNCNKCGENKTIVKKTKAGKNYCQECWNSILEWLKTKDNFGGCIICRGLNKKLGFEDYVYGLGKLQVCEDCWGWIDGIEKLIVPSKEGDINKIQKIKQFRLKAQDNPELQKKRLKFLSWLLVKNYNLKVLEMYPIEDDVIKSKLQTPQYINEFKFCNNRTKILIETRAECDKLDYKKAFGFICEICLELIKKLYHFAVFYAEGQRSPHIIIYDFEELRELKPHQREKAQAQFWRNIIPFRVHLLDQSIWSDDHYVPLEFAPHWKYGTPFNLIFEYIPEVEKCRN